MLSVSLSLFVVQVIASSVRGPCSSLVIFSTSSLMNSSYNNKIYTPTSEFKGYFQTRVGDILGLFLRRKRGKPLHFSILLGCLRIHEIIVVFNAYLFSKYCMRRSHET